MDYRYLVLVIVGFLLTLLGFYGLGGKKMKVGLAALLFIVGIASLVLGILLTSVPGFFSS